MSPNLDSLQGSITIYRKRRSGDLQVQPMCRRGRYGLAEAGRPILVPRGDDARLRFVVEQVLDSFLKNTFDENSRGLSPKEQAQFLREHDAITVDRVGDELTVTPLEHMRGGFASLRESSIKLVLPFSAEALSAALLEAFRRASG
jgi:hypothetical protein